MKSLLKTIGIIFSRDHPKKHIPDKPLQKYRGRIEIAKIVEMGENRVSDSMDYLFQTPQEVLNVLTDKTLLWLDNQNNLLGFSDHTKSLLIPLDQIREIGIQNMLQGKGPGDSNFWASLNDHTLVNLSISSHTYQYDQYVDEITKTMGFTVTFSPEIYNT